MKKRTGFTLVELIVVVAILGVLASIMLANFLELQTRAKTGGAKFNMAVTAFAMERFMADHGTYPPVLPGTNYEQRYQQLTTPIAYIYHSPDDPYAKGIESASSAFETFEIVTDRHPFASLLFEHPHGWGLRQQLAPNAHYYIASPGPDAFRNNALQIPELYWLEYDPTNGTISSGDLFLSGPGTVYHGG